MQISLSSLRRALAFAAAGVSCSSAGLFTPLAAAEAGLIGKRYAGPEFTYNHYSGGTRAEQALGAAALVNLPLMTSLDLGVGYSYLDTSGDAYGAVDKQLTASLLTHRPTELGTAYFAATLGHTWHRVDIAGVGMRNNGALWGVRAGYEVPVGARTAINAGIGYSDAFESENTSAQVLRYFAEANHWFSRDLAGVVSVNYRQIRAASDALSYTAGLRWAF